MSTIRTNAIVDNAGGNTATINGITPALASQAEAQAGTDNTKIMTPLRAAQAISALVPAPTVLLGTILTTSGFTQTLSGLDLTPYRFMLASFNSVTGSATTGSGGWVFAGVTLHTDTTTTGGTYAYRAFALIDLNTTVLATYGKSTTSGLTSVNNATTSVTFSLSGQLSSAGFASGSVRIYGVS